MAAVAAATLLAGCGDTVSNAVDDAVNQVASAPACAAIAAVQEQLTGLEGAQIPPDQLSQIQTGASVVSTAVGALGDQLPAGIGEQLDSAQQTLDTAVENAEGTAEERQAAISAAVAGYAEQLDGVAEQLGC
jgi:hypothetical protein